MTDLDAWSDEDEAFGGDVCPHCGATALESFDCALNGCRFGLLAEVPTGPDNANAKDGDNG